jgi:phosphoribosylformylglycinamidine cyclo-ligase
MAEDRWTYKRAGLDLEAYGDAIGDIGHLIRTTHDPFHVLPDPFPARPGSKGSTGFAGLFALDYDRWLFAKKYRKPVLVTCTDGVGTKLKVAAAMRKYDTVGIDLVAMSVNDCICTGGEPLIFLDYLAMHKDDREMTRDLVQGVVTGCREAECSLTGGETAIMPDVYQPGDFDMAGFCVGVVERDRIINGQHIHVGDIIIGLASSGVHSNGFSLIRKLVFEHSGFKVSDPVEELGSTVGETLLTPTRIYVKAVKNMVQTYPVKKRVIRGLAHITGGGLVDNIPRILPPGRRAYLRRGSWPIPPVFSWLQKLGNIEQDEMDRVFNMGIGFAVIVSPYYADSIRDKLNRLDVPSFVIGEVREGEPGVSWSDSESGG